jgi:arylsulfatase A-like enzyme
MEKNGNTEVATATGRLAGRLLAGLGAGMAAGLGLAALDAARIFVIGGAADLTVPGFAALLYGPLLGLSGAGLALALWLLSRLARGEAPRVERVFRWIGPALLWAGAMAIGFFFLHRDLFQEKLGLFAPRMLGSLAGLALGLAVLCLAIGLGIRSLGRRAQGARWWPAGGVLGWLAGTLLLVLAWALAGGPAGPAAAAVPPARSGMPNVLLVMNDTHRADFTGVYGGPADLTPRLDELAADGVVYEHAFAQASWTRPSVATILTGRFPSSHTAVHKGSVLPQEVTTLAEVLQGGGYETIGIATNYNLTPFFGFDQGFADYRYLAPVNPLGANDVQSKLIGIEIAKKIQTRLRGRQEWPEDYYVVGETVTDLALERLDRRDRERPFFLFLSYMDVHDPYFRHPFDGTGISHRANPDPDPDPALIAEMKELYAGEVRYWDAQLGRLLDGLKQRGLYEDTLIVVVSDHGEEFGEHGGFWHGTTLYDEQLRVIFVAKYHAGSGLPRGARVDAWIRLLDVSPLVIAQTGLPIPREMQGLPAPEGRRPVFAEEDHQGNVLTSILFLEQGEQIKLIRANEGNPRGVRPLELYRTDVDPGETRNLAGERPERLGKAVSILDGAEALAAEGAAAAVQGELTAEQKKVLQQLGYMKEGE